MALTAVVYLCEAYEASTGSDALAPLLVDDPSDGTGPIFRPEESDPVTERIGVTVGSLVTHSTFGDGEVLSARGSGDSRQAEVLFAQPVGPSGFCSATHRSRFAAWPSRRSDHVGLGGSRAALTDSRPSQPPEMQPSALPRDRSRHGRRTVRQPPTLGKRFLAGSLAKHGGRTRARHLRVQACARPRCVRLLGCLVPVGGGHLSGGHPQGASTETEPGTFGVARRTSRVSLDTDVAPAPGLSR